MEPNVTGIRTRTATATTTGIATTTTATTTFYDALNQIKINTQHYMQNHGNINFNYDMTETSTTTAIFQNVPAITIEHRPIRFLLDDDNINMDNQFLDVLIPFGESFKTSKTDFIILLRGCLHFMGFDSYRHRLDKKYESLETLTFTSDIDYSNNSYKKFMVDLYLNSVFFSKGQMLVDALIINVVKCFDKIIGITLDIENLDLFVAEYGTDKYLKGHLTTFNDGASNDLKERIYSKIDLSRYPDLLYVDIYNLYNIRILVYGYSKLPIINVKHSIGTVNPSKYLLLGNNSNDTTVNVIFSNIDEDDV